MSRERQIERVDVGQRKIGKESACVFYPFLLWSLLLLSAFACGQVCSCHDSPWNKETDRRGVPVEWGAVMGPQVLTVTASLSLCKQGTTGEWGREEGREGGGRVGAEDNELRKEKEGGERKKRRAGSERKRGRRRKTGRAVIIKSLTHSYCSGYSTELRGM